MFVNPFMLVGLSLAILPILIHLLSRTRYRSVDWGAMMFLDTASSSHTQNRRFHQWLLLLIRSLMIACLALALARPEVEGQFAAVGNARRSMAVILLDCSASMGMDENGHTRIDLAREAAKQLVSLHRGDRVSLVLMGQAQPQQPADQLPTADLWEIGRRIESATLSYARTDVARSLEEALDAVDSRTDGIERAEKQYVTFYVVTDRQRANWRGMLANSEEWSAAWKKRLEQAGISARIVCIPVGALESENVAVTSIDLVNSPAIASLPVELDVKVQNYGDVQWAAIPLQVTADRRVVYSQKVNLAPNAVATYRVAIPAGFTEAGTHVISAEINRPQPGVAPATPAPTARSSGLTGDDRLDVVIDVKEPIKVLLISGDEWGGARSHENLEMMPTTATYLSTALAPFAAAKKKLPDPCTVEVAPAESWTGPAVKVAAAKKGETKEERLNQYQVVILAGLEYLTDTQAVAIEQFVYDGGGVLIAPGELTRPDVFAATLYRDGSGILPASFSEATSEDWSAQTSLLGFEATHPVMRFLGGRPDAMLPAIIGRYFVVDRLSPQSRTLMRYANGEPFLIESVSSSQRRGRVLLLTTSLGGDWSTLPLTSFYLPFVQSAVRYLGEGPARKLNLSPGEPIELPIEDTADGRVVRVKSPDTPDERPLEVARVGGQAIARYADTESPGIYTARVNDAGRKPALVQFSVSPPRDESDLASLAMTDWMKLERQNGVRRLDPSLTPISAATALPAPLELWPWALGAVLLLAMAEMKLSRAWSRTEAPTEEGG